MKRAAFLGPVVCILTVAWLQAECICGDKQASSLEAPVGIILLLAAVTVVCSCCLLFLLFRHYCRILLLALVLLLLMMLHDSLLL